jgi:hypothetical protein
MLSQEQRGVLWDERFEPRFFATIAPKPVPIKNIEPGSGVATMKLPWEKT